MRASGNDPTAKTPNPGRRRFLRNLGLSTVAAGAAVSLGQATFVQAEEEEENAAANTKTEYRETDHVRAFYATLRD